MFQAKTVTAEKGGDTSYGKDSSTQFLNKIKPVSNKSVITQVLRQCNFNKPKNEKTTPRKDPSQYL